MPDPNLFRLRMTFCKQGRLAMLSHLEVARALERAVRRAGLPFAVSQGFSPHMKIAFGAALPVGVGGTHEVPDEVTVVRKKKEKVLCTADFLVGELELSGAVATFSLESKPTGSLRPDVLLRACCEAADAVAPEASAPLRVLSVMRTEQRAAR